MMKYFDIIGRLENSAFIIGLFRFLPAPLRRQLESRRNFVYAVIVHILFLSVLIFSYDWSAQPTPSKPKVNIIDAVAIDESRVQAEIEKLKKAEDKRRKEDDDRQRRVKEEEKRLAELQKKKAEEQQRLKEQQKKREAEEKKARELALKKKAEAEKLDKLKKQQQAEQQRLADLEKQRKAEAERQKQEKEKQAKLEAERKAKELEEKKRQEAERKAKELEEKKRQEAEQALQEQLAEEQAAIDAERKRQEDRVVDQYVEIIRQQVARNWLRPDSAKKGMSCVVTVKLMPGGDVLKAQVTSSSGDLLFDNSVERAVYRASPLKLPPDAALFERFRDLKFVFSPDS